MATFMEPLDPELVKERLSQQPFVSISGVTNVRTLGPYPTKTPGIVTRSDFLYRSGEISGITDEGKLRLRELGIKYIFDLRSDTELQKYNAPVPTIDGIEIIRVPVFKTEDYTPEVMAYRFQLYANATIEAFLELYSEILNHGTTSFSVILKHVRDNPRDGCLFHCTAGKDRTGILSAILLSLTGVEDDIIAKDYELTQIGREPVRDMVMARLAKEPLFAKDKSAALNMLTARYDVMLAVLQLLREEYGGVENYVKERIGLNDNDISIIKMNMTFTLRS